MRILAVAATRVYEPLRHKGLSTEVKNCLMQSSPQKKRNGSTAEFTERHRDCSQCLRIGIGLTTKHAKYTNEKDRSRISRPLTGFAQDAEPRRPTTNCFHHGVHEGPMPMPHSFLCVGSPACTLTRATSLQEVVLCDCQCSSSKLDHTAHRRTWMTA
jgi:hypothetical protein